MGPPLKPAEPAILLRTPSKKLEFNTQKDKMEILSSSVKKRNPVDDSVNSSLGCAERASSLNHFLSSSPGESENVALHAELDKMRVLLREYEDETMRMREREAEYDRDSRVRIQLSRRLEQVLIDRNELKEELDTLKRSKYL